MQRKITPGIFIPAALLFIGIAIVSGIHGYLFQSFLSLILLTGFLALAYPFSAHLFGRGSNAFIFTFPIGYILHALFLSLTGVLLGITIFNLILYVLVFAACAFFFHRNYSAASEVRSWDHTKWWLLFLWLFSTLAVLAVPFIYVGIPVDGGHAYRAYFNTDFFRHMAVVANLSNHGIPPENPYFSDNILRYYWFFHIIPAYWVKLFPTYSMDYLMVQFNLVIALMFSASLCTVIFYFTQKKRTPILLLPLFLFGGSYEGLYLLFHFYGENLPFWSFREWNVDAIMRWLFRAPQVDTLFRGMLYGPQHLIGLSVFVLFLISWKNAASLGRRMFLYVLLFSITGFTVIIAGALILGSAVMLLAESFRDFRSKWKELVLSAALGIAFLTSYFFVFEMFGTTGEEIRFEINYFVVANIAKYIPLNWGAILIAGFAGIIFRSEKIPVATLLFYLALCFLFIIFINIDVPGLSEITLKMGILSYVILLIFAAGFFDHPRLGTTALALALIFLLIPGVLTWYMDWYNNHDVANTKFTSIIPKEDRVIYEWIQRNVEKNASIQNKLGGDGFLEEYVTKIPAMAERPVYLGDKVHSRLYQISKDEVQFRERIVEKVFHSFSTGQISALCQQAGIDYLFVSSQENLKSFENRLREPFFQVSRREKEAGLYRVIQKTPETKDLEPSVLFYDDDTGQPLLEIQYLQGFFDPEVHEDFETLRWMNSYGKLQLNAKKRLRGNFSFVVYSEPHRRYVNFFLNGKPVGSERAKIRGIPASVKVQLQKGGNIFELREPEEYPGKKPPTEEDRTGRIYKIEDIRFSMIDGESE